MNSVYTIDVASPCAGWSLVCPGAAGLVRSAAELALARGSAAKRAWRRRAELSVVLADAAMQQQLNRDHREKDAPTNVLAFPAWDPRMRAPIGAPILLGDIVLALETVAREASEQEKPFADHLRHLVVHGVLHILGYDHSTPAEAGVMESLESSILVELGVPDPYRDPMCSIEAVPVSHE
jgi:probable rRNA maturation factor